MALAEPVRRVLRGVNVDLPALQPRSLSGHIAGATFVERTGASVLSSFGAAALALAIMGLYGALALAISQRRRELGIRLTLGAPPASIARLVVTHAIQITGAGLVVGIPLAIVVMRILRGEVAITGRLDAFAMAAICGILIMAAIVAAVVPTRRALTLDPIDVLRPD
jgi:ABC-type antimicrobial peptide transport system permease subunit